MSAGQSWTASNAPTGEYVRKDSVMRNWVSADGSTGFKAERGRYHLYVSLACPWAHRTLVVRALKGLEDVISFSVVNYHLRQGGWNFDETFPDHLNGAKFLRELYLKADPDYSANITVPVLWDKQRSTIVNNESSEIIRMLNSEFNEFSATPEQRALDLYPADKRDAIDEVNAWVYPSINNGVYRCGFAKSQEAYETAYHQLFEALDRTEEILSKNRYLTGSQLTEADVRLFTTLLRFDIVYYGHFKTNKKRLIDYPNLHNYLLELAQMPPIKALVPDVVVHAKKHYYLSHTQINPSGIVPLGPDVNFDAPHNRNKL